MSWSLRTRSGSSNVYRGQGGMGPWKRAKEAAWGNNSLEDDDSWQPTLGFGVNENTRAWDWGTPRRAVSAGRAQSPTLLISVQGLSSQERLKSRFITKIPQVVNIGKFFLSTLYLKHIGTGCRPLPCDICFRSKLPIVILNGPLMLISFCLLQHDRKIFCDWKHIWPS